MEYISSDTNVWIDFHCINRLGLPFLLPYKYVMYYEQIDRELVTVNKEEIIKNGLLAIDLTIEEFFLAEEYGNKYLALSKWDRIALAIAKTRNMKLLTGDMPLRKAALKENVMVLGTIGILDELYKLRLINKEELAYCLEALIEKNGCIVRLPLVELEKGLKELRQ